MGGKGSSTSATVFSRPSPAEVRVVGISEYKAASACLCEAFVNDKAIRYCIDTPDMAHLSAERKRKLYEENMDYVTAAHIRNGLVTTVGPNYASVAIWLPPGRDIENWCTLFRSGLWRMYYKLSRQGRQRFFAEFLPLLHATKLAVLGARDSECYYLVYLGTRPSEQRKGYGRALIEHGTQQADRENRACYLESSADANVAMYKARGFVVTRTVYLNCADVPIPLDIMIREPAPPVLLGEGGHENKSETAMERPKAWRDA